MKIRVKNDQIKKKFIRKLEQRYIEELDYVLKIDPEHKNWWLEDQGTNRENLFLKKFKEIERLTGYFKNKLVLDMGCGSGASLVALSFLGAKATGLENDSYGADLELAKLRCSMYGINPNLTNSDALNTPFDDNTFDLVISTSVIEHIKDYPSYLKEIYRILKKGGFAYIQTNNRFWPYDSHSRLSFFNWLPHRLFELAVNIKFKRPLSEPFTVWHVSYPKLSKELKKIGFNIRANWASLYYSRNIKNNSLPRRIMSNIIKLKFPVSVFAKNNELIIQK
jgi:ubiquinone/menaquinone biosynthesis C-methylase UbiE